MAGETIFKQVEAEQWIDQVEALNTKTDELLTKVTTCLQEIQNESEGPFVETFYKVGSELTPKFTELIKSLGNLITALQNICKKFAEFAGQVVDSIVDAARGMVGGIQV